jgi:ClpP class serine protease
MTFLNLLWLVLLIAALVPVIHQKMIAATRARLMRELAELRGTRVIPLIYRQEEMRVLGYPVLRRVEVEDSEEVLRAIRMTDDTQPIDLILHLPCGMSLALEQIAAALSQHPAKVTVIIPHYGMSGGALVALAADEVLMDAQAVLGPLSPLVGGYPAASVLKALEAVGDENAADETVILADVARKTQAQVKQAICRIAHSHHSDEKAEKLADQLTADTWMPGCPIFVDQVEEMGFTVDKNVPDEVYRLMNLYPQSLPQRPSSGETFWQPEDRI